MKNAPSNDETYTVSAGLEFPVKMPSVFDGEIPFMTFYVDAVECGRLWGKGGVLSFEGDAEESAKVFFDQVIERNRECIMRSK
jgi:hypothetical protein